MQITDVRISKRDDAKLRAFASITIDGCFVVRGLKVIAGGRGLFVSMPARRRPEGGYEDLAHPINAETRAMLGRVVLEAYLEDDPEPRQMRAALPVQPPSMGRGAVLEFPPPDDDGPDETEPPPQVPAFF